MTLSARIGPCGNGSLRRRCRGLIMAESMTRNPSSLASPNCARRRQNFWAIPITRRLLSTIKWPRHPESAEKLLTGIVPAATAQARAEAARMQKLIDAEKGGFQLGPADWEFYAEKVRKAEYDLDESQVKQYFELERVLQDGVFFAANKLYGITFKERKDLPVYHPDVRVFEVFDANGKSLALFYADYFQRSNKVGGAWQDSFVDQSTLLGAQTGGH